MNMFYEIGKLAGKIDGGIADGKPDSKYSPAQIAKGVKVE